MDNNTIYVSNVEILDDMVVFIPNRDIRILINCGCYGLVICCGATAASNLPVAIRFGEEDIPVLCKAGNTMYANQLKKRMRYPIMFGNQNENYENGQFIVLSKVSPRGIAATEPTSV